MLQPPVIGALVISVLLSLIATPTVYSTLVRLKRSPAAPGRPGAMEV